MTGPLVSVVIPAYNCQGFIEASVRSALGQTMGDLEVIVIDDASGDGTFRVLSSLAAEDGRIRLYQNGKNLGVAKTRNRCFKKAKGQYIALLDADDIWLPDKLEKQLAHMEQTGCDLCYSAYSFIDENGQPVGRPYQVPPDIGLKGLLRENVVGCSTVLCKAELLRKHPMRPEYAHEDYVLWLELLQEGCVFRGLGQPLAAYRLLKGSRSGDKKKAAGSRWRIYRDFLGLPVPHASMLMLSYGARGIIKHIRSRS